MSAVVLVSAGLLRPKKEGNPTSVRQLYLNYGLVGLAGVLEANGFSPRVFHGEFTAPKQLVDAIARQVAAPTPGPLLLSLPSMYCLPWARAFCREVRRRFPQWSITCGGRWVVDGQSGWIRQQLPDVDLVVFGQAENQIVALAHALAAAEGGSSSSSGNTLGTLNAAPTPPPYSVISGFQRYQPSVEISRGCGMGCAFCAEQDVPLSSMKAPERVAAELRHRVSDYGSPRLNPYFEASIFRPTLGWSNDLARELDREGVVVDWRCESRVDALPSRTIAALRRTGLRVLDLGLESASPRMLRAMGKTTRPDVYLRRASQLLRDCGNLGIWCKVNVLLYPSETRETLEETRQWLGVHSDVIKGVSAYPVVAYRTPGVSAFVRRAEQLGATLEQPEALDVKGYSQFHLSAEISAAEAIDACRALAREMMSARDYYDLKAFSYFERGFQYSAFIELLSGVSEPDLPFRLPADGEVTSGPKDLR